MRRESGRSSYGESSTGIASYLSRSLMADECSTDLSCRDKDGALLYKIGGLFAILVASTLGVVIPLLAKGFGQSKLFFIGRCFAAGVILATGFVHILPDAFQSLTSPCLPQHPWTQFPFVGFFAMLGSLGTLVIDSSSTSYSYRKACKLNVVQKHGPVEDPQGTHVEPNGDGHGHGHFQEITDVGPHGHGHGDVAPHGHGHAHAHANVADVLTMAQRSKITAQVLEFGIITHSIIIGIAMGASQSPCTIKPLLAALSFHQFFEGLALGGCISIGGFGHLATTIMALFFSLTTPLGIAIGIAISNVYNENSPKALILEGTFDSISAGILTYMALVDLIASEFLSSDFIKSTTRQILGYASLLGGAFAMALLAIWA